MAKILTTKKQTKSAVITKVASLLFREKGYNAASMRELAEQLNVEAPSLYNHINSKAELLRNICGEVAEAFTNNLDEITEEPISSSKKLEKLIRFHIKTTLSNFDMLFVANHEWRHLPEPWLSEFLQQRKNYENRMVQIIKQGILAGEFKNHQPQVAALTILSALRGLEFWQKYNKLNNVKALENNIVQQLLTGIIK